MILSIDNEPSISIGMEKTDNKSHVLNFFDLNYGMSRTKHKAKRNPA